MDFLRRPVRVRVQTDFGRSKDINIIVYLYVYIFVCVYVCQYDNIYIYIVRAPNEPVDGENESPRGKPGLWYRPRHTYLVTRH